MWQGGAMTAPAVPVAHPRVGDPAAGLIAVLCAVGAGAHLVSVRTAGAALHPWVFAGMALACLACAVHLVRSRSRPALTMSAGMAALMVVAHLAYLFVVAPSFTGSIVEHGHLVGVALGGHTASAHAGHDGFSPGVVLPLLAELGVLAVALPALRRLRISQPA
jgi:hypothetical protein